MAEGRYSPRRSLGTHRLRTSRTGGGRSSTGFGNLIRERMASDPMWHHATNDGRWVCPYCLNAIRGAGSGNQRQSLLRAVERHLTSRCSHFNGGEGAYQPSDIIKRATEIENIAYRAMTDAAWQVFDNDGVWYSPASLQRVPAVRIQGGRFDGFAVRRMAEHLVDCPYYRQGHLHAADVVQQARDRGVRIDRMASDIRRLLSHQIWRYVDPNGTWVCPYCLAHPKEVVIRDASDWHHMTPAMAVHLLEHCTHFTAEQQTLQTEEAVRASAAGESAAPVAPVTEEPVATTLTPPVARTASDMLVAAPVARPVGETTSQTKHHEETNITRASPRLFDLDNERETSGSSLLDRLADEDGAEVPASLQAQSASEPSGLLDRLIEEVDGQAEAPHNATTSDQSIPESPSEQAPATERALAWMDADDDPRITASTHAEDMDRARDVQQGMLRDAPQIPGYTFATRFESCDAVSGDFYEFIALGDGRIGFAQGDVSGHGIQAGLIMSMAKKVVAIYARQGDAPSKVLAAVNDALVDDLGGRMFVTITYAILDPSERTITWARAGHNPAIIYNRHSGDITEVKPNGMVVGMKSGPLFGRTMTEEVSQLRPGDMVMVYTDGLTEMMNRQQEEYGTERLFEVIREFGSGELEPLLDRVMDSVRSFRASSDAQDDVTITALAVD